MARLASAVLCLALPVGALCAPLMHAHLDRDHDDHHRPGAVHAHFSGHAGIHHDAAHAHEGTPGVAAGDEPEQATRLQIFVAVEAAAFTPPALPPARFALTPVLASVMRRPPHEVRSHGPPAPRPGTPRAPPLRSA